MKKLRISILCALFLFSAGSANLCAQTQNEGENYYSNPKKGIKPDVPKAYYDTNIVDKTDNLTVELVGLTNDTTPKKDTTGFKLKPLSQYSRSENPYYWGPSIYYSWDPWYSSYWNTWYYPGWGGSHWRLTYSWGYGPYWSYGYGWSWGWGSPWWYWDPYCYPYYAHYGYYGYYWGGYAYHHNGWRGYGDYGHGYLGGGGRGAAVGLSPRGNNPVPSPSTVGRGTVRRGGVDLNNGGRAPRGSISGTGSVGRGSTATASHTNTTGRNVANNGRYAKPESVNTHRMTNNNRNSKAQTSRNNIGNSRSSYSTPARSSRFESGQTTGRSSSFNSNPGSSRSTSSSFRSSTPSRSSGFSGGSSSRSSGGFSGGGSRGGGGGHSSRR